MNKMEKNAYTFKRGSFASADGKNTVATYRWEPVGEVRAVVQICHGMSEYIGRYEGFATYLASCGFAVGGNDHLGHGYTAATEADLGYTARKDGVDLILSDLHSMSAELRRGREHLPFVLFGHSMGSFFARLYVTTYAGEVDAAIFCGTAGFEQPTALAKLLAKLNIAFCGERNRSRFLYSLSTGSYYKKFPKGSPSNIWLTADMSVIQAYATDPLSGFRFTARAYYDLFDVLTRVSKRAWAKRVPKELPILLMAGDQDPVGNFGKGVRAVHDRLQRAGVQDLTLHLYEGDHHEILNELDREHVLAQTLAWLCRVTAEVQA